TGNGSWSHHRARHPSRVARTRRILRANVGFAAAGRGAKGEGHGGHTGLTRRGSLAGSLAARQDDAGDGASAVRTTRDSRVPAVGEGDLAHDCKAQSAPIGAAAEHAVEALE